MARAGLTERRPLEALPFIVNALNQQHLEEKHRQNKGKLSAEGHHALCDRLNNTGFLAPTDAKATQNNIYNIEKRVIRYCQYMGEQDWLQAIKNCDKGFVMSFLCHICGNDHVGSMHTPRIHPASLYAVHKTTHLLRSLSF